MTLQALNLEGSGIIKLKRSNDKAVNTQFSQETEDDNNQNVF